MHALIATFAGQAEECKSSGNIRLDYSLEREEMIHCPSRVHYGGNFSA
jgi:hypothetical protein